MNRLHRDRRAFHPRVTPLWALLLATWLAPWPASAQQVRAEIGNLIKDGSIWFQGIAMSWGVLSIMRAGLAFMDPEESQHAPFRLKRSVIGLIIIFAAVGIVQFVKSRFTTQSW